MTDQQKSRRILIAVLLLGALLLAAPWLWQAWISEREPSGKTVAFDAVSPHPAKDLLGCLVQRPTGGLKLEIVTTNHFVDPARGIAVRIAPEGAGTRLKAWINAGGALTPGEAAQLRRCAG